MLLRGGVSRRLSELVVSSTAMEKHELSKIDFAMIDEAFKTLRQSGPVDFQIKRERHVMVDQLNSFVDEEMPPVAADSGIHNCGFVCVKLECRVHDRPVAYNGLRLVRFESNRISDPQPIMI
jgi:hypothetical protein